MDSRLKTLQIRKLRKKIRQIENLESLERDLNDEEISKCLKKDGLREELLFLLSQLKEGDSSKIDEDFNSSCSVSTDWSESASKSASESDINIVLRHENDNVPISTSETKVEEEMSEDLEAQDDKVTEETIKSFPAKSLVMGCSVSTDWSVSASKSASESDINVVVRQENDSVPNLDNETYVEEKKSAENLDEHDDKVTKETIKSSPAKRTNLPKDEKKETKVQSNSTNKGNKVDKGNTRTQNSKLEFWNNSGFIVTVLEGHNDLVTAVDCKGSMFVSASRDTTVKVWDMTSLTEKRSLGSHTGSVTDVVMLSYKELGALGEKLGLSDTDHLILSGSLGCSLKLWSAETGELLKSIYTYNPITKVTFHPTLSCAVTASDGGKVELWDLDTKENITSHKAHEDSVTGLVVRDGKIFTSCAADGEIKVFEVRDNNMNCLFASENIHTVNDKSVTLRHIRALNVKGDQVFYGDDGVNLKCLSWKKGVVKKIANHKEDFGMTDAIHVNQDIMLTSAFDLDTGYGYLNAFDSTSDPSYLTTINCEDCGRILDVTCCHGDGQYVTIVTAGTELRVWTQVPKSSDNSDMIPTQYEQVLSQTAVDSDLESDVEFSESDSEDGPSGSRRASVHSNSGSSWMSWCNLV